MPIGPMPAPELLAPAGDRECLSAALENGADAVYFGLKGHNARARATNFDLDELPEVMATLHRRGAKGFVTLNTLSFPGELAGLERIIRAVAEAGVDAAIVQDLGLARLIRAITPDLEVHASTQMTVTSAAGMRLAKELGCTRVVLARELSLKEIAKVRDACDLPVEVFVHGALCVAYSGQCLTSESLGGRSANRGACAQACRLPYEIIADGEPRDLADINYLLSPQDLAAHDLIPKLVELGVASLKIEGRLKSPEYVASVTKHYRGAIDRAVAGNPAPLGRDERNEMELMFSRGFSAGFLNGNNHKVLVRGDASDNRGIYLGRVVHVRKGAIAIDLAAPVKRGDGLVIVGDPIQGVAEQGGRVYEIHDSGRGMPLDEASAGRALIGFGRGDVDVRRVVPGQHVWKTDDPAVNRRLRESFQGRIRRRVPLDLDVKAVAGEPLVLAGRIHSGKSATVRSAEPLAAAHSRPATEDFLREQLGRLGDSVYRFRGLDAEIAGDPLVPSSLLNALRRDLVAQLDAAAIATERRIATEPVLPVLLESLWTGQEAISPEPSLAVLCREVGQVEAALAAKPAAIYLDFHDIRTFKDAIPLTRRAGIPAFLATPRIEKPGEENLMRYLAKQGADGILARHHGALYACSDQGIPFVADFSLNISNALTAQWLRAKRAVRVTASYDLDIDQLCELLESCPPGAVEVVAHQHMPMFHMEHCVYCAFLSPGTDKTNCGRPCDRHDVKLKDRVGSEHPLRADVGCRNTLFNAVPQSAAREVPRLIKRGARAFRVELLEETPEQAERTIRLYQQVIAGEQNGRAAWSELKASDQYGVTRGTLAHRPNDLDLVTLTGPRGAAPPRPGQGHPPASKAAPGRRAPSRARE